MGLVVVTLGTGCSVRRNVTIMTLPTDAAIWVDGVKSGEGRVSQPLLFANEKTVHVVTASRLGYKDKSVTVTRDYGRNFITLELARQSRRVSFSVSPVAAIVKVDGNPVILEPTIAATTELEFVVDAQNQFGTHVVTAEREGFATAEQVISWSDAQPLYTLRLEALTKDVHVDAAPVGTKVFLDGKALGDAPAVERSVAFPYDPSTGKYDIKTIRAEKPGYPPVEQQISWEDGKTDYVLELKPRQKTIKFITEPKDVAITLGGTELLRSEGGVVSHELVFAPINDVGELKTYKVDVVSKSKDAEFFPQSFTVAWDDGKTDYPITLKEILTRNVPAVEARMKRGAMTWEPEAFTTSTIAMKDVSEPGDHQPKMILQARPGQTIGSITLSPDGQRLVYTVVTGRDTASLKSQLFMCRTDGTGGSVALSDGKSLDITPTFTPAGDAIVFSSNRAGRRMNLFSVAANGGGGVRRLTMGDTSDLWPSVDAEAKPRLFYQALVDTRSDARLYQTELGTIFQTDLTPLGGTQPRVSPKNDAVVYCAADEKTGNSDIFRISDQGGQAENLTNNPASDDRDPSWNLNGSRVAFASDRGAEPATMPSGPDAPPTAHFDIWVLDPANPANPTRVTSNASIDDQPLWEPSGDAVYFRSNRGGCWGVWKIAIK